MDSTLALSQVRQWIDTDPPLTYQQFLKTDGECLTTTWSEPPTESSRETQVKYLHYLCFLGHLPSLQAYLQLLRQQHDLPTFLGILNDRSLYCQWYGTPLHTLVDWNNSVTTVQFLVEQGANPNLTNYYQQRPGRESVLGSIYVMPFKIGSPLEADFHNLTRRESDWTQVIAYLNQFQVEDASVSD